MEQELQIILTFPKFRLEDPILSDTMFELEDVLMKLIADSGLGYLEGNEFGPDTFTLYFRGLDCQKIFELINPVLKKLPPLPGSFIVKKYGSDNVGREIQMLFN